MRARLLKRPCGTLSEGVREQASSLELSVQSFGAKRSFSISKSRSFDSVWSTNAPNFLRMTALFFNELWSQDTRTGPFVMIPAVFTTFCNLLRGCDISPDSRLYSQSDGDGTPSRKSAYVEAANSTVVRAATHLDANARD